MSIVHPKTNQCTEKWKPMVSTAPTGRRSRSSLLLTKWSRVEEAPERSVPGLETGVLIARTWEKRFEDSTENVGDDLDEELADEDRLRAKILVYGGQSQLRVCAIARITNGHAYKYLTQNGFQRPMPRNHILNANTGSAGSSSSERRRVAAPMSIS